MSISIRWLLLSLAALTLPVSQAVFQGCTTTINSSTPADLARWGKLPKAQVYLDGVTIGSTPARAELNREQVHRLRIELAGYQPFEFPVKVSASSWHLSVSENYAGTLVNIMINSTTGQVTRWDQANQPLHESAGADASRFAQDTLRVHVVDGDYRFAQRVGQLRRE